MPLLPIAERESLNWVNGLVGKLWPKINEAAQKIVSESVEPKIQEAVPGPLKGIHFKQFTLGSTPFQLGPCAVFDLGARGLRLSIGFNYLSDQDIELECGPASIGLKNLSIKGELIVRLSQFIGEVPVIGGINAYFLNVPSIHFEFTGAASILNLKGVAGIIRKVMAQVISGILVLPNQISVAMGTEEQGVDLARMKCPAPIGLLKVQPMRARGLKGADWSLFGKATSDPYAVVQLADQRWETSTVKNTCDPDWADNDFEYFAVYDREQHIHIRVFDEDFGSADDLLGVTKGMPVAVAIEDPAGLGDGFPLYPKSSEDGEGVEGEECGRISVGMQFYELVHRELGEGDIGLLKVKLDEAVLPHGAGSEAKVIITMRNGDWSVCKESPVGTAPAKKPVEAAASQVLCDCARRCAQRGMSAKEISEITTLPVETVQAVVAGDTVADVSNFEMPTTLEIEASLFIPAPKQQFSESTQVEIVVANKKSKEIAKATVGMDTVLGAPGLEWRPQGPLECKGPGGDVSLDVQLYILGTRAAVMAEDDLVWTQEQTVVLGAKGEEDCFQGKADLLSDFTSVVEALKSLNADPGLCPQGFAVVYSERKGTYVLLYKMEKKIEVFRLFNLRS